MSDFGDSFTETTHKSWFSRIGGAIVGVLIGLLLLAGSSVLLFWNEGRAVQTERSLAEGRTLVVDVDAARVDAGNEGKLVHVNGDVKAAALLRDAEFGVAANGLRLVRGVEMYQWKEESHSETHKTLGGGEDTVTTYTYRLAWSGSPIDSSRFRRPDGHNNPPMRYRDASVTARDATLGAFRPARRRCGCCRPMSGCRSSRRWPIRSRADQRAAAGDGRQALARRRSRGAARGRSPHLFHHRAEWPGELQRTADGAGSPPTRQKRRPSAMARSGLMTAPEMFKVAEEENAS